MADAGSILNGFGGLFGRLSDVMFEQTLLWTLFVPPVFFGILPESRFIYLFRVLENPKTRKFIQVHATVSKTEVRRNYRQCGFGLIHGSICWILDALWDAWSRLGEQIGNLQGSWQDASVSVYS